MQVQVYVSLILHNLETASTYTCTLWLMQTLHSTNNSHEVKSHTSKLICL